MSGILSATVGQDLELGWLKPVARLFFLDVGPMPIGFFFGVAVALGIWLWTGSLWSVPVLLVTTMYAWSAAIQVAIRLQRNAGDDPHLIAASLGAGRGRRRTDAPGAAPCSRRDCAGQRASPSPASWARSPACCSTWASANIIDGRLLYLVWQPAVAFCIGMGLAQARAGCLTRPPLLALNLDLDAAPRAGPDHEAIAVARMKRLALRRPRRS